TGFVVAEERPNVIQISATYGAGEVFKTNRAYIRTQVTSRPENDYGVILFVRHGDHLYIYDNHPRNRVGEIDADGRLKMDGPVSLSVMKVDAVPSFWERFRYAATTQSRLVFLANSENPLKKQRNLP